MEQSHYFFGAVEVFERNTIHLNLAQAIISKRGIHQIYNESPGLYQAFLEAKVFLVRIDGISLHARLVREQGAEGSHYNLKLIDISSEAEVYLEERLKRTGFSSPWKRQYPRIPMTSAVNTHFEVPAGVIFPRVIGQASGRVVNFSYHGMFFEFFSTGISLGEYVGKKINFHIITNRGLLLGEVEAKIMRIHDQVIKPGKARRGLGVKFIHFDKTSFKIYQDLILELCAKQEKEL